MRSIERYLQKHAPQYSSTIVSRIIAKAKVLESQPYFGSMVSEFEYEGLRELLLDSYRIIYRIDADDCVIVAVTHSSQNLPADLAE